MENEYESEYKYSRYLDYDFDTGSFYSTDGWHNAFHDQLEGLKKAVGWIEHNITFQLDSYKNKYVRIKQNLNDNPNKHYEYILFIERLIPVERSKVRVDSSQITVFCYINGYIDSVNIYTKSPKCNDELNIIVDAETYKYTVQEITRTEYDDELFKALNANIKYDD